MFTQLIIVNSYLLFRRALWGKSATPPASDLTARNDNAVSGERTGGANGGEAARRRQSVRHV